MVQLGWKPEWGRWFFGGIMLLLCCDGSSHRKVMDEKLFVQVYCDVVVHADLVEEEQRAAFVDSVLSSYGVQREDFQRMVAYYAGDVERWEKVFAAIVAELERREKAAAVARDSLRSGER